ncbi:DUF1513 domain-containing protein [Zavarzinia compransoris]|uniref:DUF1513 domain-containing protein n=1 Tax=Zavarzinia compransoris TaxID=1264899 RepID=A0A317DUA2_9PROT|nr:DUF1513 domain-containing protein [Zavarzinia compransoris]PWR17972.1 DUF1513 domain-containing protein [Zavarzinia compransoris]TDP40371.1 hypothetical protein DES42_1159 [Zavarzinia compransoris]
MAVRVTRRRGLGLMAAALAFARRPVLAAPAAPRWFGTRLTGAGAAFATAFDDAGRAVIDLPLPARGHGVAVSPDRGHAVVIGRRPGTFALAVRLADGAVVARAEAAAGRHFCGHGIHGADGRLFFATETDFEGERGLIGVYDVAEGYRRVAEWESGGLDPHDVRLLPGGRLIAVANGGILTHPDAPGAKLNLDEMDSSLSLIDVASGAIVHQYRLAPDLFQLSIRHLAIGADGSVAFAMQSEGPADRLVPLGGVLRPDGTVQLLEMPRTALADLRQYCGSLASDAAGRHFGMTSPRGGSAAFFAYDDGRYLGSRSLSDVCPIAADPAQPGRFYIAGGHGGIAVVGPGETRRLDGDLARTALWDNHMALVSAPQSTTW